MPRERLLQIYLRHNNVPLGPSAMLHSGNWSRVTYQQPWCQVFWMKMRSIAVYTSLAVGRLNIKSYLTSTVIPVLKIRRSQDNIFFTDIPISRKPVDESVDLPRFSYLYGWSAAFSAFVRMLKFRWGILLDSNLTVLTNCGLVISYGGSDLVTFQHKSEINKIMSSWHG